MKNIRRPAESGLPGHASSTPQQITCKMELEHKNLQSTGTFSCVEPDTE